MLEMVTKISQAEDAAATVKREAQQKAAELETAAHRAGKVAVEKAKGTSDAEAAVILETARQQAAEQGARQLEAAAAQSHELTDSASAKLGPAAQLIVERIVETK